MDPVPHQADHGAGYSVDPGRPGDHRGRRGGRRADQLRHAALVLGRGRGHRHRLPGRRGGRGTVLWPAVGQTRPAQAVHDYPGGVPDRQRADCGHLRCRARLGRLPVPDQVHRRDRDRRGVRSHQLRDRRDDPGPLPGPGRHRRKRHLLGRVDHRHPGLAAVPECDRPGARLAARLPDRPGPGRGHHLRPARAAGKPAVAADPRRGRRSRTDHHGHRTASPGPPWQAAAAAERQPGDRGPPGPPYRLPHLAAAAVHQLPAPRGAGRQPDDHPVVPVQRDLLHLHPGADQVLPRKRRRRRST